MTEIQTWIRDNTGHPACPCPTHVLMGAPVRLTYIEQASGERKERWKCPIGNEEYQEPAR